MDVKTTFLNGDLEEEIYMKQPEGFITLGNKNKLNQSDKCIYSKFDSSSNGVIICLYVDDMLIFGTDQKQVDLTKDFLSSSFVMEDMGEADVILGVRIKRENKGLALTQSHYIEKVLKKFNYLNCSPVSTPEDPSVKLMPNTGEAVSQLEYSEVIASAMESEFIALAAVGKEAEWLRNLVNKTGELASSGWWPPLLPWLMLSPSTRYPTVLPWVSFWWRMLDHGGVEASGGSRWWGEAAGFFGVLFSLRLRDLVQEGFYCGVGKAALPVVVNCGFVGGWWAAGFDRRPGQTEICIVEGHDGLLYGSVVSTASIDRPTFVVPFLDVVLFLDTSDLTMAKPVSVDVWNPNGKYRVVSTKPMPGTRWINLLIEQDCRLEICTQRKTILSVEDIIALIGDKCDGVIGQLTEDWGETLFAALSKAGGTAFSNMAVGYNNVDVNAANKYGIAVGNTPGVLTETTAELAAALSLAAARRIVEADGFMRAGLYDGWLPNLFVGNLLKGQTVGVIGAGRIGSAYARMMVEGFKMNLIYFDLYQSTRLEKFVTAYGEFLKSNGEQPVTWKRASSMDEVLTEADLISLHPILDKTTYHLVNKERLSKMKKEAILINCSRGPVVDEVALVEHLRENPMFRVGLDVFEDEPYMKPGLADMKNAVVVPHIASASKWTREGMATLAALNVLGKIKKYPLWSDPNKVEPFLDENSPPPAACPSIVNAKALSNNNHLLSICPFPNCEQGQTPERPFCRNKKLYRAVKVYMFI
ncbi:unnamed protein product [Rhodiola kirilowii]